MAKVLSVKQPWVTAIVVGIKVADVRSWKTDYRGRLLLHASKEYDYAGEKALGPERMAVIRKHGMRLGGIVAETELVTIIPYLTKDMFARQQTSHLNPVEWWKKGLYGWVFDKTASVNFIPVGGQLNLWNYGD